MTAAWLQTSVATPNRITSSGASASRSGSRFGFENALNVFFRSEQLAPIADELRQLVRADTA